MCCKICAHVLVEPCFSCHADPRILFADYPKTFFVPLFQIRAANLSGDCAFSNEVARFNFGLKQHHQVPAGRTALISCERTSQQQSLPSHSPRCVFVEERERVSNCSCFSSDTSEGKRKRKGGAQGGKGGVERRGTHRAGMMRWRVGSFKAATMLSCIL